MAQEFKLESRQYARPRQEERDLTVPQIRALLVALLEATEHDAGLGSVAPHLRHAVGAIDDARAVALAVMQEADAEGALEHAWAQTGRSLC